MSTHVFVLMLENRSFDHMLGFSGIAGADAVTGAKTQIDGLSGGESNTFNGKAYGVQQGAGWAMPVDPGHEFPDVLTQLCGPGSSYAPGGAYPSIHNSGFATSYANTAGAGDPGEIMKCFTPEQLPVLNALAREFAVCDRWYSSVPGPTWPNRMFVHAASSAGLDHSPTTAEILEWETLAGFSFQNGNIFDRLMAKSVTRRLYAGDEFPMVAALKGIGLDDIRPFHYFANDLQGSYPYSYTFIEPSYNATGDYNCSTSQHPLDDVTRGEALIKCTYEAIRNSPLWPDSLLIVTWDEHGGFYDHAAPGAAMPPGDQSPRSSYGFTFEQYGGRVPAVIVSPRIPQNLIDHRVYDHASIPATLENLFGLVPLTRRDAAANELSPLLSLATHRDTPSTLPAPAVSGLGGCDPVDCFDAPAAVSPAAVSRPDDPIDDGNLPGVVHVAMQHDMEMSPGRTAEIRDRVASLQTRGDAAQYLSGVRARMRAEG
ncbi:MAG: alkaline phosphatase family protein [Candidatus Sulfopaludibacter sp.]|nr:alkaline phosphatase family protein [Candidatus Sulfopaludibacter sp.]